MIENKKLVTVVVPVFNVERYLRRCVDSITNQTYTYLDIILSDDGSTDSSSSICDEYIMQDKRISVIHAPNAGLSEARNRGIEHAKGEYICFIDSDDYIAETYVEYLLNLIETNGTDMAICPFIRVYPNKTKAPKYHNETKTLSAKEACNLMFLNREHVGIYAWNKLYKLSLFRDIRYPVGKYFEDSGTTYKIVSKAQRISYGDVPQYYYQIGRQGAITSESVKKKQDRYYDKLAFLEEMERFYHDSGDDNFPEAFYNMYIGDLLIILSKANKCNPQLYETASKMIDSGIKYLNQDNMVFCRNVKMKMMVYKYNHKIYSMLFK